MNNRTEENIPLWDLHVDGILKQQEMLKCLGSFRSAQGPFWNSCEHSNETSGSMKFVHFLTSLAEFLRRVLQLEVKFFVLLLLSVI
jgi:hypothetical protein